MSWNYVAKPTDSNYTYVSFPGKERFDDTSVTYDSSSNYYDGVNLSAWTQVAKPSDGINIVSGMITGLMIPLTYTQNRPASGWAYVAKPTS